MEAGDWPAALALLDDSDLDPDALELRASALYGNGDFEAAVAAWEQVHSVEVEAGDEIAAGRAAAMVAMYLMMDTGLMAPVRGWIRTAQRLLDGHADSPAHALLAVSCTYERFMCGDMAAAADNAARAIAVGTRTATMSAVVIGRVAAARIRIFDGDLDGGLEELNEIGALLMSGAVDSLTTGMMYCELVCAFQGLGLHDLAAEWTEVMERWRHGAAFGGIHGRCRVHRAEILRVTGPCDAAEAEALAACDELRPWMRREFGWPLVELGIIRLRRGDLSGAEEAFAQAAEHAWSPQPGLALLRLAEGDTATAADMIADAVEHPFDVPWKERPPVGDLRLAPLLDAQAEIAFAAGDVEGARHAADALDSVVERYASPFIRCWAALARARAELLAGDPNSAMDSARAAVGGWTEIGAPYETAMARLVLGRAQHAAGNQRSARLEWRAAEVAFTRFGARGRAAEAAALHAIGEPGRPRAVPSGLAAVFTTDGISRTVGLDSTTASIPDLKGFRYVARLLADPGREFHVLDLVAAETGVLRPAGQAPPRELSSQRGQPGLPVLDTIARDAYRRRLAEVDADIDDARTANDTGRLELAERDRDYLVAELKLAVGLSGRDRTTGGSAERARTSVTRTIRYALGQLAGVQPELAERLSRTIRTGTYCTYDPDPFNPIEWRL